MKTPLQEAMEGAEALRRYGIRPTDYHYHVGENGTRCEFCGCPVQYKVHDPHRLAIGEEQPLLRESFQEMANRHGARLLHENDTKDI